jgi:hypothetical protein
MNDDTILIGVWWMPDLEWYSWNHATYDRVTTLCGRKIPERHHIADLEEPIECEACLLALSLEEPEGVREREDG